MSLNPTISTDRGQLMRDRTSLIINMTRCKLSFDWIQQFELRQLMECCARLTDTFSLVAVKLSTPIQKELIQNPQFAEYLSDLLKLSPEASSKGLPSVLCAVTRQETAFLGQLTNLLDACQENGCRITDYPVRDAKSTLDLTRLQGTEMLVFLKNFALLHLPEDECKRMADVLRYCNEVPIDLSDAQRDFLLEPFVASRYVFASNPFPDVFTFFSMHPELLEITRLLHLKGIDEELDLRHYKIFAENLTEYARLIKLLADSLDPKLMGSLLSYWSDNDCPFQELQRIVRMIEKNPKLDWSVHLYNYSSYVNLLYGVQFKEIDLKEVNTYQAGILNYAIINRKKSFIRLVDRYADLFLSLPRTSMLFMDELYRNYYNLNELTEQDLRSFEWMKQRGISVSELIPGRRYTFTELATLYDAPPVYVTFYNLLASPDQDHRLLVLRQLRKQKVLHEENNDELTALAQRLDSKTLYDWINQEFGHIARLDASTAVQLLIHLDALSHMLPSFQTGVDVTLALRNLSTVDRFSTVAELKSNIIHVDEEWLALSEAMELSEDFIQQYMENIVAFLSRNGAHIVITYLTGLSENQKPAFLRVVKAELMGRFHKLKYFDGDLQRELDYPISDDILTAWKENMQLTTSMLLVEERDDFFSTMLAGSQPKKTCLSYDHGRYRYCLLSSFDSNKKILYASADDRIVGRAFLRLTKGRLSGCDRRGSPGFTFADVEAPDDRNLPDPRQQEQLVLFLEHPYVAGIKQDLQTKVLQAFVNLATEKADELGVMLVLSASYWDADLPGFTRTMFHIYISKSKAGAQYLDSLDGEASVATEGKYGVNQFFVRGRFDMDDIGDPPSAL